MNGKKIVTKLDYLFHWIVRLVILNGLWILFSLLGLFVVGIFPATAAVLGVARKWMMGDQEIKIWNTYKQIYRSEFSSANGMGWILSVIGIILYLNYRVILNHAGEFVLAVPFAFYLLVFFYIILVIWSFPLLVHYKATWRQHFKNAIIIGLTKIHYTIVCGAAIFAIIYFSLGYPGIIPFFTISLIGVVCMWFTSQIFQQLDQAGNNQSLKIRRVMNS
ncbi:YesL family protein [Neobacillus vireti]|uniref:YesL family protein n=1 Tax=Neobacillus vireti TaxID=220686 RepID=UPI002FFE61E4